MVLDLTCAPMGRFGGVSKDLFQGAVMNHNDVAEVNLPVVIGLFECQAVGKKQSERMHDELESILKSIHQLLVDVWDESPR